MENLEFLSKIKEYIEDSEMTDDAEHGTCRKLDQIIEDGDMPEIYKEVLNRIEMELL